MPLLLFCALLWPGDLQAEEDEEADGAESQSAGIAYEPHISGEMDDKLKQLLEQSSQLFALKDQPPPSLAGLRLRAEGDLKRLTDALRSEGYYDSQLKQEIDDKATPPQVTIEVTTGPVYKLTEYKVIYEGATPEPDPAAKLSDLGLKIGDAAVAETIIQAQRNLVRALQDNGYPLAEVEDRRTVVDHATRGMNVELKVSAGPLADFGPVTIEGLTDVDEDYVRALLPWKEGERYDEKKIEEARLALSNTSLFSSIRLEKATAVNADGQLPITVRLAEGPPRSIGFGLSYSTSVGPGGEAFWEHRNIFGNNERLRLSLSAALIEQTLNADFRKPNFLRLDQSLLASGTIANRETDAFEEQSARAFVGLERKLSDIWTVSGGGAIEYSILTDETEEDPGDDSTARYLLYSTPLSATRDTADDLLNPTKGTRATFSVTPYAGTRDLDEPLAFLVTELSGAGYLSLDSDDRIILAGRTRIGSILGQETDEIPASKRFYSGGGGSVRGYAFQSIGPEDDKGDPIGGRSVFEVSAEVRLRITEDIGLVPFIDGGIIGEQPFVDFEEDFLWAGGLGLRYYTGIGPLRLDVAFPINGRESDDIFQFYISLGQAF